MLGLKTCFQQPKLVSEYGTHLAAGGTSVIICQTIDIETEPPKTTIAEAY